MFIRLTLSLLALVCASSATAHHSHSSLNRDDVRVVSGVVTKFMWRSPHVYLQANVLRDDGSIIEYTMEMGNPMAMGRSGWSKQTLQPGDRITWQGAHDRDPDRAYMGLSWIEHDSGDRLYASATAQKQYLTEKGEEIPAYLDQTAVAEPAAAIGEGTWSRIAADGGRFKNIYGPELIVDWPFTEQAQTLLDNFDESQNPMTKCIINGPPRGTLSLAKFQWSRSNEGTIAIDRDLWPQTRIIHLDSDAPAPAPTAFGHAVGWFEDDELHVRTTDFTGEPWGIYSGLDSSSELTLKERYWLSDEGMRLNVEMTITDPVMLTETITVLHQWQKIPDSAIVHAECSLDNANFFITAGYN